MNEKLPELMNMVLKKIQRGGKIHPKLQWTNITPQEGHYAFGYYDRNPFSSDNRYHLAIRFGQQVQLPAPGEQAEVGIIDIASKEFIPIAQTEAWCHQQGSMTQWLPTHPKQFIFNDFARQTDGRWKPISRIYDIHGHHIKDLEFPIYILSHNGKWGLTLNFARIPRRGYSYAQAPKPETNLPDIEKDGLFLVDMTTFQKKLLIRYQQLLTHLQGPIHKNFPNVWEYSKLYHWLNHASFNVDDSRVMILHRYQNLKIRWKTDLWTCNLDGSELMCPFPNEMWSKWHVSHQLWGRTPHEILVDGKVSQGRFKIVTTNYWVFDELHGPQSPTMVSKGTHLSGHLNFSPDGQWLLGDTYPHQHQQLLSLTQVATKKVKIIGRFYHSGEQKGDWRCDLHPRWSADGRFISVDTVNFGERKILITEFEKIKRMF